VVQLNITLGRFFALSLAIHAAVFTYLTLAHKLAIGPRAEAPPIAVSLLPPREKVSTAPASPGATKAAKMPATVAKKDSKIASRENSEPRSEKPRERIERARPTTAEKSAGALDRPPIAERNRDDPVAGLPVPTAPTNQREIPIAKSEVGDRRLPTVKELLPPLTYSSGGGRNGAPVSLNTKDPVYVSYFNRIKIAIEQNWEYPELALRYGLQGRLSLEFAIGANGQLEQLRIIRSSGSQLLDDEALRAIRAAAPFPPIPSWIKGGPVMISASMEYNDNRLNYRDTR